MDVCKAVMFSAKVEDRPGMLAEVTSKLAAAGINIVALTGWSEGGGQATIACVVDNPDKVRELAASYDAEVCESEVVLVEDDDRVGAGRDLAQKIAAAGVNIKACVAQSAGGKYQALFHVDAGDVDTVVQALSA